MTKNWINGLLLSLCLFGRRPYLCQHETNLLPLEGYLLKLILLYIEVLSIKFNNIETGKIICTSHLYLCTFMKNGYTIIFKIRVFIYNFADVF